MYARLRRLLCLTLLCIGSAQAAMIEFSFAGRVTDDAMNGCGGLVACGVLGIRYSFDSGAIDGSASGDTGLYSASSVSLSIDGTPFFSAASAFLNVANLAVADQYGLLALGGSAANGSVADLSVLLQDLSAAAFASDALPLSPSALSTLLPGSFSLFAADDSFQLQGVIDSVTCSSGCGGGAAPEPATMLLLIAGLAGIGVTRRRMSS